MTTDIITVFIASYLSGSIPFGLILTKIFLNKDLRKIGSKNIGATNVLRTGNKKVAGLTLFLDVSKGIIPILITKAKFLGIICHTRIRSYWQSVFLNQTKIEENL